MRYYQFTRKCGHTTRGANKAKSLATVCNDCTLKLWEGFDTKKELPRGFGLWPEFMRFDWLRQNQKKGV